MELAIMSLLLSILCSGMIILQLFWSLSFISSNYGKAPLPAMMILDIGVSEMLLFTLKMLELWKSLGLRLFLWFLLEDVIFFTISSNWMDSCCKLSPMEIWLWFCMLAVPECLVLRVLFCAFFLSLRIGPIRLFRVSSSRSFCFRSCIWNPSSNCLVVPRMDLWITLVPPGNCRGLISF